MAREIVWTEQALTHLEFIAAFVAQDSPVFAELTVARIVGRFEQAAQFPESGRVVPEYGEATLREPFWKEYRLIYRVEEQRVMVIAIVHGRMQLR